LKVPRSGTFKSFSVPSGCKESKPKYETNNGGATQRTDRPLLGVFKLGREYFKNFLDISLRFVAKVDYIEHRQTAKKL